MAFFDEDEARLAMAEVCGKHAINTATRYQWKSKYAATSANTLKRFTKRKARDSHIKRLHADLALENVVIEDVLSRSYDFDGQANSVGLYGACTLLRS